MCPSLAAYSCRDSCGIGARPRTAFPFTPSCESTDAITSPAKPNPCQSLAVAHGFANAAPRDRHLPEPGGNEKSWVRIDGGAPRVNHSVSWI
jgi:hypothetical protein